VRDIVGGVQDKRFTTWRIARSAYLIAYTL